MYQCVLLLLLLLWIYPLAALPCPRPRDAVAVAAHGHGNGNGNGMERRCRGRAATVATAAWETVKEPKGSNRNQWRDQPEPQVKDSVTGGVWCVARFFESDSTNVRVHLDI